MRIYNMARTLLAGEQIKDGGIYREDLNTNTTGKAVITKAIAGSGILIENTGIDAGTGDVTFRTYNVVIINSNRSAEVGDDIYLDGTSVITITLPADPVQGNKIRITDMSGDMTTNNAVINRNGKNIMKLAENFSIDENYKSCEFVYLNSIIGWGIVF